VRLSAFLMIFWARFWGFNRGRRWEFNVADVSHGGLTKTSPVHSRACLFEGYFTGLKGPFSDSM
jgi:hypothetical protein